MPHYRTFYEPGELLEAADLGGRDVVVEIDSVTAGTVGRDKHKSKKPMISFVGKKKKLACNKTNGKIIAALYGTDVSAWKGKRITLYPTTTQFGGETVECIRCRPSVPSRGSKPDVTPEPDDDVPEFRDEPGSGES